MISEDKPSFINVKHVLFPIMGFLLFAFGKLLNLKQTGGIELFSQGLYLNFFTNICFFMLAHLSLHFLLAMYEQYLYQSCNLFQLMAQLTLNTYDRTTMFVRAKMLPCLMEAIQRGFGFFILVDITLMLIYWLLHLYHAYFTFQVRIQNLPLFLVSNLHSQEGIVPALASALVILAEFSRVFMLSDTSTRWLIFLFCWSSLLF